MVRLLAVQAASVALIAVGLLGAGAFHPDDGTVVRSMPLWRVFGIAVYAAVICLWLSILAAAVVLARAVLRRGRRRQAGTT